MNINYLIIVGNMTTDKRKESNYVSKGSSLKSIQSFEIKSFSTFLSFNQIETKGEYYRHSR